MMAWKEGNTLYMSTQCFSRVRHEARQDSLQGQRTMKGIKLITDKVNNAGKVKILIYSVGNLSGISSAERLMAHHGSQDNTVCWRGRRHRKCNNIFKSGLSFSSNQVRIPSNMSLEYPHIPGMIGFSCCHSAQSTCPVQGEASLLPRGHICFIRDHKQFRILPKCSKRVHQSGT